MWREVLFCKYLNLCALGCKRHCEKAIRCKFKVKSTVVCENNFETINYANYAYSERSTSQQYFKYFDLLMVRDHEQ